jgi:glycosyltransferase involved in cell wall biosynthesis
VTAREHRRRVLIILENLSVPFDTRVWNEATALAGHGYAVSVICPQARGEKRFEVIDDVFIYRHPQPTDARGALGYLAEYGLASFWQLWLTWRVRRERGFDAIHACNPPDTTFLIGRLFKLLAGTRFVFDHHDLSPELYEAKFGRRDWLYRVLLRLERWTFQTADLVISTNESYRRIAVQRGGVNPDRVWVVRSGPTAQRLPILAPNPELKHGRAFLVGYVGTMARQDGVHYLLEAARHVVHDRGRHDVHFSLVGSGPELDALRAASARLRIAEYVTFTGRVPDRKLAEILNSADVCVDPDEVNELNDKSTMNKVMEYMAVGKPVVQFETIEGRFSAQEAALYARPNDARDLAEKLLALIDDGERRRAMGAAGLERVRTQLAWPHQAAKLLEAYEALFAQRP